MNVVQFAEAADEGKKGSRDTKRCLEPFGSSGFWAYGQLHQTLNRLMDSCRSLELSLRVAALADNSSTRAAL